MKMQIIYIHGGDSFELREDFLAYLKTAEIRDLPGGEVQGSWKKTFPVDLGEDYEVFMPSMPNKQNAQYDEWKIWFERYLELVSDGVVLVGHSLGGMFLAKYLSENTPKVQVSALYLLAAPGGEYASEKASGDCASFTFSAAAAATIAAKVDKLHIWHSEDDFVVPVSEIFWYQKYLPEAKITIFKDKNHFLLPELPELIDSIKNL